MRRLTPDELVCDLEVKNRADFDAATKLRYGDFFTLPKKMRGNPQEADDICELIFDEVAPNIPETDIVDDQENPLHPTPETDILMNAEVLLPQGEELRLAKVIRRRVELDGRVGGNYNDTPILNTILYYVQFTEGDIKPYLANLIAENILMQVDADEYHYQLLDGIQDHSKDKRAVDKKDMWIVSKLGRRSMQKSTVGWKFRVKWKDGTNTWTYLKELKEPNPIEVTKYTTACCIQYEHVFAWWVPFTLCN